MALRQLPMQLFRWQARHCPVCSARLLYSPRFGTRRGLFFQTRRAAIDGGTKISNCEQARVECTLASRARARWKRRGILCAPRARPLLRPSSAGGAASPERGTKCERVAHPLSGESWVTGYTGPGVRHHGRSQAKGRPEAARALLTGAAAQAVWQLAACRCYCETPERA